MSRITRQDWLDGAVKALADGGFAALAVEPLARQLKISKGSFYHHFDSLDDLVQQLLVYWEAEATEAVSDTLDQVRIRTSGSRCSSKPRGIGSII